MAEKAYGRSAGMKVETRHLKVWRGQVIVLINVATAAIAFTLAKTAIQKTSLI